MTGMVALKSAYAVVWIIELGYIWYLVGRYRSVRREMKDLERSK
jgi:CcmD family protein